MRLLGTYLTRYGRPATLCGRASLFETPPKTRRSLRQIPRHEAKPAPATQIGRALSELGIAWTANHAPEARSRSNNGFGAARQHLLRGLRAAGVETLVAANRHLEELFLPWWRRNMMARPSSTKDARRPLCAAHDLGSILSIVETRYVAEDGTIRFQGKCYRLAPDADRTGLAEGRAELPGAPVRMEVRLDGSVRALCCGRRVALEECEPIPKVTGPKTKPARRKRGTLGLAWRGNQGGIAGGGIPVWRAAQIDRARLGDGHE